MLRDILYYILSFLVLLALAIALYGCERREPERRCPRSSVQVLVFTSAHCGPCQRIRPILLSIQATGVDVRIIDIDEYPDVARAYGVVGIPTFFVRTSSGVERTQDIVVLCELVRRANHDR